MITIIAHIGNQAVSLAATLIIHATCILLLGMAGLLLCRRRMAYASLVLRICVAAVLLTPFSSALFLKYGILQFHLPGIGIENSETVDSASQVIKNQSSAPSAPLPMQAPAANNTQGEHNEAPASADLNSTPPVHTHSSPRAIKQHPESGSGKFQLPRGEKPLISSEAPPIAYDVTPEKSVTAGRSFHGLIYGIIAIVWLLLSGYFMLRIFLALGYISRLKNNAHKAKHALVEECEEYSEIIGVTPPPILLSQEISTAFITGIFNPVILLPCGHPDETYCCKEILLHELAHLSRHDTLWNMLGQAGKIMIPFHPLMWSLDKQMKITNDFICDDIVLNVTNGRMEYAEQLYRIAEEGCLMAVQAAAGVGFLSVNSSFLARIERILDNQRPLSHSIQKRHMIVTIMFGCIGFISIGFVGISATGMASMPKTTIDLNTQLFLDQNRILSSPLQDESIATHRNNHEITTASVTEHPAASSGAYNDDTEKSIIIGNRKDAIRHIMDAVEPGTKPIEFRFHTYDDKDFSHSAEFASSLMSEDEKTSLNLRHPLSPDDAHNRKTEYNSDTDILGALAFKEASIQMAGMIHDNAVKPVETTYAYDTEQTFKPLEVVIPAEYDYGDLSDPDRTRMSEIYRSLSRSKLYPVWSPDGEKIAFNDKDFGVWVVNADGGEPRLIFDNYYKLIFSDMNLHYGELKTISFSPDGKELAYRRFVIDQEYGTKVVIDDRGYMKLYYIKNPLPVIESVNIETMERRILAENTMTGCWSPDGEAFAYITEAPETQRELWLLNISEGSRRMIPFNDPSEVCFGPDGSCLLVTGRGDTDKREIVLIDLDDEWSRKQLVDGNVMLSDISPDGRWMLYAEEHEYEPHSGAESIIQRQPMLFDMDTGEHHQLPVLEGDYDAWGRFSPDSESLCFNIRTQTAWEIYLHEFTPPAGKVAKTAAEIPSEFSLKANFPNPFNMSTTIEYSLAEEGDVSLIIYNSLGQKVRALMSEYLSPGAHTAIWDGLDDDGNTVSTGTYIAKLSAAGRMSTLKMSLVK